MKKLFIHIGLHKTATTSLQYEYFPNLKRLSYYQYSVPNIYTNLGTYDLNDFVLITNEELSGTSWDGDWKRGVKSNFHWIESFKSAIKNLKRLHPEATILIMFRKHGDLLLSMYKQYVQEGGVLPFEEFYGDEKVIRDADLSFEERIKFLEQHYSDIVIFSFEEFKKEGVEYLNRYFGQFGLTEINKQKKNKTHNRSLTGTKLEMLRKINHWYYRFPSKLRTVLRLLRLSPRDILQKRLTFWRSDEPEQFNRIKAVVNEKFISDWEYVESRVWRADKNNNHQAKSLTDPQSASI